MCRNVIFASSVIVRSVELCGFHELDVIGRPNDDDGIYIK